MMHKVSIIVIIYKVARFLDECLKSISDQTFENIEIICVVGKGDTQCERIVSEHAEGDQRIIPLIREPLGTAAARNEGLKAATGDLIAFVDGDDHIDKDMMEILVNALIKNDADISVVGKYHDYENLTEGVSENKEIILSRRDAYEMLLRQNGFFLHIWDKLYKRELFNDISFDTGKKVEDREVVFKLISKADRIVYETASKYHFRVSEDSGSRVEDNLLKSLASDRVIADAMLGEYPELKASSDYFLIYETISVIQNHMLYGTFSREHDRELLSYVRKNGHLIYKDKGVLKGIKIKVFLCGHFPGILKLLTLRRRKAYYETHKEFKTGTDWEETFRKQGIE
ncbi:MAG: glycosyltransferase [Lachnospiraceae bacterium]|nr:glycosyltransferase [Lachnospiraceae bacterium]